MPYYEKKCQYGLKRGWRCSRQWRHEGPCALRPRWWNLVAWLGLGLGD